MYETGKSPRYSTDLRLARVYFDENYADERCEYGTEKRSVYKVYIKGGKIIRIIS
jgi:hypothetical protein